MGEIEKSLPSLFSKRLDKWGKKWPARRQIAQKLVPIFVQSAEQKVLAIPPKVW